jgi:anti-sigma-K factor RskA
VRGDPDGGDVVTTPEMHLDAGALALGALPADELPAVEEHIDTCDSCREELAGFRETVVRLAAVAAEAPPASLRRSVLAAIAVTPQLPPIDRSGASTEPLVGRHREADEPPPTEPGEPAPSRDGDADVPGGAVPDNVRPLRPWYRRPASWIAAAAAAVVLVGGGLIAVNQFRGQQQVAQTPEQCVATAADRTRLTPENGQGAVFYAPSCAAVTVDVTGLPALPADRTYQLWALSEQPSTAPRSLGLLPSAANGQPQTVTQPTQPGEVAVAITAEPASGSASPTLPIVWTTELTS